MREDSGHYERAFDQFLRERRAPYVSVDEARRLLAPPDRTRRSDHGARPAPLKYFDYVVYAPHANLLIELKGRRLGSIVRGSESDDAGVRSSRRMECWVTRDDVTSMLRWEGLFGASFEGVFVFVYECLCEPPESLFQDVVTRQDRWYAFRAVRARDYAREMKVRSTRWGTVDLLPDTFARISSPVSALTGLMSTREVGPEHAQTLAHPLPDPDSILSSLGVPLSR